MSTACCEPSFTGYKYICINGERKADDVFSVLLLWIVVPSVENYDPSQSIITLTLARCFAVLVLIGVYFDRRTDKQPLKTRWLYSPTFEEQKSAVDACQLQYQKIVEIDGIKIQVEMLDTAGTEQVLATGSIININEGSPLSPTPSSWPSIQST